MIDTLVNIVIYILVVGLIFWLLNYLIDNLPMQDPFRRVAKMVLMVCGVLILIVLLLGLLGGSTGVPRIRIGSATRIVAASYLAVSDLGTKVIAVARL